MHELSMVQKLFGILVDEQAKRGFKKIVCLTLALSPLAGIDQQALAFAFAAVSRDTFLEGAELVLETHPAAAFCLYCAQEIVIAQEGQACPCCHHFQWVPKNTPPLTIVSLIVED